MPVAVVIDMASEDKHQHADNPDRVLIRPSSCCTRVVKKSSVGHVPHEPSKGAVGRDLTHSSVPGNASTAAHGGHRTSARLSESAQKPSLLPRNCQHDVSSATAQENALQPSSACQQQVSDNSNHYVAKPAGDNSYRTSGSVPSDAATLQSLKPAHPCEPVSCVSLSGLVEDGSKTELFSGTLLNHFEAVSSKTSVQAATSQNFEALESELIALKEQLVVQSKVHS